MESEVSNESHYTHIYKFYYYILLKHCENVLSDGTHINLYAKEHMCLRFHI